MHYEKIIAINESYRAAINLSNVNLVYHEAVQIHNHVTIFVKAKGVEMDLLPDVILK